MSSKPNKPPIWLLLADELVRNWPQGNSDNSDTPGRSLLTLPSRREWARRKGVAEATAQRSLHEAARVLGLQRSPRRTSRKPFPEPPTPITGARRLDSSLRAEMRSGVLGEGQPLPKLSYMAAKFRCSNSTVLRVYRALEAEGLARKQGRHFQVGPAGAHSLQESMRKAPKGQADSRFDLGEQRILVLMLHWRGWERLHQPRTSKFPQVFQAEAERRGVRLEPVFCRHPGDAFEPVVGLEAIVRHIRKLKNDCLGILVPISFSDFTILRDSIGEESSELTRWLSELERAGTRVVWFDRLGERDPRSAGSKVLRCRFDESGAVRVAWDHLLAMGHRRIWFGYDPAVPWQTERARLFSDLAAKRRDIRLLCEPIPAGDELAKTMLGSFVPWMNRFSAKGPREIRELIEQYEAVRPGWRQDMEREAKAPTSDSGLREDVYKFLGRDVTDRIGFNRCFLTIAALLRFEVVARWLLHWMREEVTAVVFPSDAVGVPWVRSMALARLRLPDALSVISFDNADTQRVSPLTSIDFGFGSLGYWAFHGFLRDIPLPLEKNGSILAQSYVSPLGTTGPPRDGPLKFALPLWLQGEIRKVGAATE